MTSRVGSEDARRPRVTPSRNQFELYNRTSRGTAALSARARDGGTGRALSRYSETIDLIESRGLVVRFLSFRLFDRRR
jgi:hypothetical protein